MRMDGQASGSPRRRRRGSSKPSGARRISSRRGTDTAATGSGGSPLDPNEHTEFIRQIGRGGFGEVWLVKYFGRLEAWKLIPRVSGNVDAAIKEVLHARSVTHPQVVNLIDIRDDIDKKYLVLRMDYIEGRDLHVLVRDEGIRTPTEALVIVRQVAEVLKVAHSQDVIHLDLKPQNLIHEINKDQVFVTDFGIAASVVNEMGRAPTALAGTPFFMAPEQSKVGGLVGPDTDVWALGVTFYYLLCGHYPYLRNKLMADDKVFEQGPRPIQKFAPWLEPRLLGLIERMLSPDQEQRIKTMGEILGELTKLEDVNPLVEADDAFASSQFDQADKFYARKGTDENLPAAVRNRAKVLRKTLREREAQLGERIDKADALLAEGKLLESFEQVHTTPLEYSRSDPLQAKMDEVNGHIQRHYQSTPAAVQDHIRYARFTAARGLLTQIDSFLKFDLSRAVLLSEGQAPVDLQGIYATVDDAEERYSKLHDEIESALEKQDFRSAQRATEQLYIQFTALRDQDRLETLGTGAREYDLLQDYKEKDLQTFALDPVPEVEHGALRRAIEACERILATFPLKKYASLEEVERQRQAIKAIIEQIVERVERNAQQAEALESEQRCEEASQILNSVSPLVHHTDVFEREHRQQFRIQEQRVAELAAAAQRAFEEGRRLYMARRYQLALQSFARANELAPKSFSELQDLTENCRSRLDSQDQLEEEVPSLVAKLRGTEVHMDELLRLVQIVPRLGELRDNEGRARLFRDLQAVMENYFGILRRELGTSAASGAALSVLEEVRDVLTAGDHAMWQELFVASPAVEGLLREVLERCVNPARTGADLPAVEQQIEFLEKTQEYLSDIPVLFRLLDQNKAEPHPITSIAELLDTIHSRHGRDIPLPLEERSIQLCELLATVVDEPLKSTLTQVTQRIRQRRRKWDTETFLKVFGRRVAVLGAPVVVLFVIGLAGWFLGASSGRGDAAAEELAALSGILGASDDAPLQSFKELDRAAFESLDAAVRSIATENGKQLTPQSVAHFVTVRASVLKLLDQLTNDTSSKGASTQYTEEIQRDVTRALQLIMQQRQDVLSNLTRKFSAGQYLEFMLGGVENGLQLLRPYEVKGLEALRQGLSDWRTGLREIREHMKNLRLATRPRQSRNLTREVGAAWQPIPRRIDQLPENGCFGKELAADLRSSLHSIACMQFLELLEERWLWTARRVDVELIDDTLEIFGAAFQVLAQLQKGKDYLAAIRETDGEFEVGPFISELRKNSP